MKTFELMSDPHKKITKENYDYMKGLLENKLLDINTPPAESEILMKKLNLIIELITAIDHELTIH
jgi:hypothetical protein